MYFTFLSLVVLRPYGFCSIYYVTESISKYFPLDEMLASPGYHPAFTCCSPIYISTVSIEDTT